MSAETRIRAYETMQGWWATTVRALSLVLVLALLAPGAIHAAEAHRLPGHEASLSIASDAASPGHPDGCPACHATCGCHLAISVDGSAVVPVADGTRPTYDTADAAVASVSPDRLPRPPRA